MKTKHSLLLPVILTGVVLLAGCSGKNNPVTPTQAPDSSVVTAQVTPTPDSSSNGNQNSDGNNNQNPAGNDSQDPDGNGNLNPDGNGLPADGQNGDWGDFSGDWGNWNGEWNQGTRVTPTPVAVVTIPAEDPITDKTKTSANEVSEPVDVKLGFGDDGKYAFAEANTFYTTDVRLTITAPYESTIYYTLDGSEPTAESSIYTEPLIFKAHGGRFPEATILRVKVLDINGNWSKTAARTYLAGTKLTGRFTTVVFSISGDPGDLTEGPDGIFYGKNYEQRGRESERMVHIEAWRADGTNLIDQYGGVRIYGGYNRQATLKSMKLFSRKSYDEDNKNFKFSEFNTMKLDGSEKIIKKYDKLVLRNCGNDNQFAFIRDELSQRLVQLAGFECYEQVIPAVAYLNGQYYNLFWLHESYCDKYLKEKFGDAEGEFIILEGEDTIKKDDDDPATQVEVDAYNKAYNEFINSDLNDDAVYKKLCDFMDVEDYLNFFAWNICLNNWDWPNNNFKCYRYVEASDSVLSQEGAITTPTTKYYDGRWRFLPHDMDYTYGLYGQDKTQANYNTLRVVMNKNNVRYSPLFTKLMDRKDCRSYFRAKCLEFCNGALSEESIISTYKKLHAEREEELAQYYLFLERMRRLGEDSLWTSANLYSGYEEEIYEFARDRVGYVLRYMDELLPELE